MSENLKMSEIYHKFSFKQFSYFMKKRNAQNNTIPLIPTTMPNKSYLYNIIKEEKNQTLRDIWVGLGWEEEITREMGFDIGKFLNAVIPQRKFEKIENDYNGVKMNVRLYHWYEIPFIICIIYAYFDILNFIPSHWLYSFYEETNIAYIVYNLNKSNIPFSKKTKEKLEALSHNRAELHELEEYIYQKAPLLINKNHIFKHYYKINAKYGMTIEILILQYLEQK
jgi:hypothetical protein